MKVIMIHANPVSVASDLSRGNLKNKVLCVFSEQVLVWLFPPITFVWVKSGHCVSFVTH